MGSSLGRLQHEAGQEERAHPRPGREGIFGSRTIEQTSHIRARPETVWRYFTDPARLAQWWGAAELDARPRRHSAGRDARGPTSGDARTIR
ncbi:SRPBCC family protein [Actinomadura mexicana]|uniref:SRPBCC family protein n=1 Tax=Actinomadura mexicana TaxID=134959 RepID=UPI003CCC0AD8